MRRTLAAIGTAAVTLGVPAGLVLATSAPASACIYAPSRGATPLDTCSGGGGTNTYAVTATPQTTGPGDLVTAQMTITPAAGSPFDGTSATQFSIAPDGTCSGGLCTPAAPGPHTITGAYSTVSSTGLVVSGTASTSITVLTPDHLVISPSATNVTAGDIIAVGVQRVMVDGTILDDVTRRATVTLGGTPCPWGFCTATAWGKQSLDATLDGMTASTEVFVNTGPVASLQVTPQPGAAWTVGQAASFTVEAVDAYGNGLEDLTADSPLTISPDGTCTGNVCTPAAAGSHTVTATYRSLTGSVTLDVAGPIEPPPPTAEPRVSIGSTAVLEGNSGRKAVHLTVKLSAPSPTPVSVSWHTVKGTALPGQDFVRASGTVTIPAGQLTGQVTVYVIGDRKAERNETFTVVLTSPNGATLGNARGTVLIKNDD